MVQTAALLLWVTAQAGYVHHEDYLEDDFFKKWDFVSGDDPTHGFVDYLTAEKAVMENLVRADASGVFIGVDNKSVVPGGHRGRKSIRLESIQRYNSGLFIISLDHVPTGCGSWPAFWMFGDDGDHTWPEWGEFDIMEWIHEEDEVSTTLHTKAGCAQKHLEPGKDMKASWNPGMWGGTDANDCWVHATGQWANQGCSQRGLTKTIGPSFNEGGGGTYAAEWDPIAKHMRVWIWATGSEPADVTAKTPDPDLWGQPTAYFSLGDDVCHTNHFKNMRLVFDITFCGDLAGATFMNHCGEKTRALGHDSCTDYVRAEPSAFHETYWAVRSLDVYHKADPAQMAQTDEERQCRSEHTSTLQNRIQELESILFRKDAELRELYSRQASPDLPPSHRPTVMES